MVATSWGHTENSRDEVTEVLILMGLSEDKTATTHVDGGVESLGFEQRSAEAVELVVVTCKKLGHLGVSLVDEALDFLVDYPVRFRGRLTHTGEQRGCGRRHP
jgi:hypothetical protein